MVWTTQLLDIPTYCIRPEANQHCRPSNFDNAELWRCGENRAALSGLRDMQYVILGSTGGSYWIPCNVRYTTGEALGDGDIVFRSCRRRPGCRLQGNYHATSMPWREDGYRGVSTASLD
jgi:hypothetical protein